MKTIGQDLQLFRPSLTDFVNVASVPQRSPFRYPGGKTWLIPQIRRWMLTRESRPAVFIEPFAGGGSAGLTAAFEGMTEHVVLAELDPDVAAVWRAMLDKRRATMLAERIESFELTAETARSVLDGHHRSVLDRAFATLLRNRIQHGGIMAPGASLMRLGENGKGIDSRWYPETLAKRIRAIRSISERISFVQGDAFEVIERYRDTEGCLFFVDPPYTVTGRRLYRHSTIDHESLFERMSAVTGDTLLTYDDSPEVRRWADRAGFEYENVSMKSRQNSRKSELLIGRDLSWVRNDGERRCTSPA